MLDGSRMETIGVLLTKVSFNLGWNLLGHLYKALARKYADNESIVFALSAFAMPKDSSNNIRQKY